MAGLSRQELAGIVATVAAPAVTWILVGPEHEAGSGTTAAIDAPTLHPVVGALLAGLILAAAGWSLGVLVRSHRARGLSARVRRSTTITVSFGIYVGLCARTATARVHGANLGMGTMVLATPFVVAVALAALAEASRLEPARPKPPPPPVEP